MNIEELKNIANKVSTSGKENINLFDTKIFETLAVMLNLNDDEFDILAPIVLENYEKVLSSPDDKVVLAQAMNAMGIKLDALIEEFKDYQNKVNGLDSISTRKKDFLIGMISILINAASDVQGISKKYITIPIEFCDKNAKMPTYAHITDSGLDIYAIEDIEIKPGETKLIRTGLKVAIPKGYELQVRPKSGISLKTKLRIANTPGTIDSGYRDEIGVIIDNIDSPIKDIGYELTANNNIHINSLLYGRPYTIEKGSKIAQLVLIEVPKASFYQIDKVSNIEGDRGGGFGSTGLK